MLKRLMIAAITLFSASPLHAASVGICHVPYALCAASGTEPTGNMIEVNGTKFREGVSVCPVLTGDSVADLDLMNGSCDSQPGWVWSLFAPVKSFPQAPSWTTVTAKPRTFFTTTEPTGGMSNMWSYPCQLTRMTTNGVTLANCYGPMNESPNGGTDIPPGTKVITQAPLGVSNPVGGNVP